MKNSKRRAASPSSFLHFELPILQHSPPDPFLNSSLGSPFLNSSFRRQPVPFFNSSFFILHYPSRPRAQSPKAPCPANRQAPPPARPVFEFYIFHFALPIAPCAQCPQTTLSTWRTSPHP